VSQPPPLPLMGIFPLDADYWAQPSPAPEDPDHPLRYGDLCIVRQPQEGPALLPASWSAAMVVHPTCELTSNKAGSGVQVVRVTVLADLTPAEARSAVMLGYRQRRTRVELAYVHTVYLAAVPGAQAPHDQRMVANLRILERVPVKSLERIGAMTADARVLVLRGDVYFRFRWMLSDSAVRGLEAGRIRGTPYAGPRPAWAK